MGRVRGLLVTRSQLHTRATKGATDAGHSVPAKSTPEDHAMPGSPNAVLSLLPSVRRPRISGLGKDVSWEQRVGPQASLERRRGRAGKAVHTIASAQVPCFHARAPGTGCVGRGVWSECGTVGPESRCLCNINSACPKLPSRPQLVRPCVLSATSANMQSKHAQTCKNHGGHPA